MNTFQARQLLVSYSWRNLLSHPHQSMSESQLLPGRNWDKVKGQLDPGRNLDKVKGQLDPDRHWDKIKG